MQNLLENKYIFIINMKNFTINNSREGRHINAHRLVRQSHKIDKARNYTHINIQTISSKESIRNTPNSYSSQYEINEGHM